MSHIEDEVDRFLESLLQEIQPPPATTILSETELRERLIELRAAAILTIKPAGPLPVISTNASATDESVTSSAQPTVYRATSLPLASTETLTRIIQVGPSVSAVQPSTTLEQPGQNALRTPQQPDTQLGQVTHRLTSPQSAQGQLTHGTQTPHRALSPQQVQAEPAQAVRQAPARAQAQPVQAREALPLPPPPPPAQEQPSETLGADYTLRYRAIQAMFGVLHQNPNAPAIEHQLLGTLDEAYAQGEAHLFESIYNVLLKKCQLGRED